MKNWIIENLGKVITATALFFSVVGFIAGMWKEQVTLGKEIEKLQLQVQELKDGDIWWIKQKLSHTE